MPLPLRQKIQAMLHRKGRLTTEFDLHLEQEAALETQTTPCYRRESA
jgi:hypothetical protein